MENPEDYTELISPHAFDGKLPARVPLTYNFGPKIGEADVSLTLKEQEYALTIKVLDALSVPGTKPCPECGDPFTGITACSASCIRLHRFAQIAAGRPDPLGSPAWARITNPA